MIVQRGPVEGKVWGSTIGTGAGATVSAFVLWMLGVLIWGAAPTAVNATEAVAAVPLPVAGLVSLLLTVGGAFIGGYLPKHTPRLIEGVVDGEIEVEAETGEGAWAQVEKPSDSEPKSYKA